MASNVDAGSKQRGRINLSEPRYDQNTFTGRYKHFFAICNPLNIFHTDKELQYAKDVVQRHRKGENFPSLSEEDLWKQKVLYDSAFHPITDKKVPVIGRMSAQCPANTIIVCGMLFYYKTRPQLIFWQLINQSYNAIINMANASDPSGATLIGSLKSFIPAVGLALTSSLYFSSLVSHNKILARLVPFSATSAANAVNIPLCRQDELREGIQLFYNGRPVAKSKKMARLAISEVVIGRIAIAVPHMVLIPILMNTLTHYPSWKKYTIPIQLVLCGGILIFSTPFGCALYPQKAYIPVGDLEPEVQEVIKKLPNSPKIVYYNKGL